VIAASAYAVLVAALVVRFRSPDELPLEPARPLPGDPVWLARVHHALLGVLLIGAPIERLFHASATSGRGVGFCLFAIGVVLYRVAGRTLGDALSPFTEPRETAPLVTHGLYRHLRHPIYVSQALIAVGAPLLLGCRDVLVLASALVLVLAIRVAREEEALARTFPDYSRYAAQTKRIVPFVY